MIIYVAGPFSHPDESVRNARFETANEYAAKLMEEGHIVFSPLSHSVPISRYLGNPNDSDFYVIQDLFWLECCEEMHVLMIDGVFESSGVRREMDHAKAIGVDIKYIVKK